MPQVQLKELDFVVVPVGLSEALSMYVERGRIQVIFRRQNFSELAETLVTGDKKTWTEEELYPFINFVIMALSEGAVLHYSLESR